MKYERTHNARKIFHNKTFHLFPECMDGLFHKTTEWCMKYGGIKTTEKLLQSSKNG